MSIVIPEHHEIHYDNVREIAESLIKLRYWDGFELSDLNNWLSNFKSDEEKYLSAGILLSLIYRNEKSISSFASNIIQIKIPNILSKNNIYQINSLDDWHEKLTKGDTTLPVRFSTIDDDTIPGKSGDALYRSIQRKFFHKKLGIKCRNLDDTTIKYPHVKAIFLLDDMLGTGEQFEEFVSSHNLDNKKIQFYYFPLAGIESSAIKLNKKYENIKIIPVEMLTDAQSLFSCENNAFRNNNTPPTEGLLKQFYLDICKERKIKTKMKVGYGDFALTYLFKDSIPNNNIAMLWYDEKSVWTKLTGR
ncbi:phosphoribosyltransferase-like protein [Aeromonas hydrophila]|uniref:phosphoribosyltransferase-like protein n=1 Tax=Aeromonas hydrophila TaxID=644 RepID=UPI002B490725|nr:hypothetical protein [Aeromonas hydrophila]